jgi:hypothetical protein
VTERSSRRDRAVVAAAVVLVLVPVAIAAIRGSGEYTPIGDDAIVAVRSADVLRGDSPSLGMPSATGIWGDVYSHHPGPLLFWLDAPFVAVGGPDVGLLLAVAALATASVVGAVVVAHRQRGLVGALLACVYLSVTYWALDGPFLLSSPQNRNVATLPFACFLFLTWGLLRGDRRLWPWWAVVGSLLVQADLTFLVPVAALMVLVGVSVARGPARPDRRTTTWTSVVLVVCWAVPAAEALRHAGGNVADLARAAVDPIAVRGVETIPGALSTLLPPPIGPFAGLPAASVADKGLSPRLVVGLVAVALAAIHLWRRHRSGRPLDLVPVVVAAAAGFAGILAVTRLPVVATDPQTYYFWMVPVAGFLWLGIAVAEVDRPRSWRWPAASLGVLVLLLAVDAPGAPWPVDERAYESWETAAVPDLVAAVEQQLPGDGPYELVSSGGPPLRSLSLGLLAQFDDRGEDLLTYVLVPQLGIQRSAEARGASSEGVLWVLPGDVDHPPAGARRLAAYRPPGWDEDRVDALARDIEAFVRTAGAIELAPGFEIDVGLALYGWVPDVCPVELRAVQDCTPAETWSDDPDRLLEVGPRAMLGLYRAHMVASPRLPADLEQRLEDDAGALAVDIWLGPPRGGT